VDFEIWDEAQGVWTGIGTFDLDFSGKRFHTLYFDIPFTKTNKVKVTFTNSYIAQIQLAEILLLTDPADLHDWVKNSDDCDDTNASIYPAAECKSEVDECTG
jgi:hypothetical protein